MSQVPHHPHDEEETRMIIAVVLLVGLVCAVLAPRCNPGTEHAALRTPASSIPASRPHTPTTCTDSSTPSKGRASPHRSACNHLREHCPNPE